MIDSLLQPKRYKSILSIPLILLLVFGPTGSMFSQSANAADSLAPYEKQLLNDTYEGDSLESRVIRLETFIYGAPQPGGISDRAQRLTGTLQRIYPPAEQPMSSQNTPVEPSNSFQSFQQQQPQAQYAPPRQQDATDYPQVTAIEREVFSRDFIHDDITVRLNRLEKKVFGASNPSAPLSDRVDKLSARIPTGVSSSGSRSVLDSLPNSSDAFTSSSMDIYRKIEEMEKASFNNQTFPKLLATERLDQLEKRHFGATYSGQSVDTRINRLLEKYQVRGTQTATQQSQYQTAYPQPTYQGGYSSSNSMSSGSSTTTTTSRPNIMIGSGFSENSTSRYSPELLNMLPNDVRQRMSGNTGYSSGYSQSTGVGGTGNVIIQETTEYPAQYPGFQTYGAQPQQVAPGSPMAGIPPGQSIQPPIQYRNYYSTPGATVTMPQTIVPQTTVPLPGGGSYTYSETYTLPQTNLYTGNPAVLEELNNLETKVFGQINAIDPVPIRLNKLEESLTGQNYYGYPDEERIQNLHKTIQAQSLGKLFGKGTAGKIGRTAGSMLLGVPMNTPQTTTPVSE